MSGRNSSDINEALSFKKRIRNNANPNRIPDMKNAIALYLVSIVAANLIVNYFGPSATIIVAFLFI